MIREQKTILQEGLVDMRNRFDEQLNNLNNELITMGALCEEAISAAVKLLIENDHVMKENVLESDKQIDQKERDIENLCMKLLMQQQPVASDLRTISSALKMISDMERIGDQASDIAEMVPYVIGNGTKSETHIEKMAKEVIRMTNESIDSFVNRDLALAKKVINNDDMVDELFLQIKKELIHLVQKDNQNGEYYMDLLMIAKYLERIGDHTTNIAEWVEYTITGKHQNYDK